MKKNTNEEIGFVFIHGAGLEGRIWSNVAEGLGQPSLLLDFPLRKGPVDSRSDLALEDYVSHMEHQVNQWGIQRFVIVAHSLGGVLALKLASKFSDRLPALSRWGQRSLRTAVHSCRFFLSLNECS